MSPSHLMLLARSIRHSRWSQLWSRLRLTARRKLLAQGRRLGFAPGSWYLDPAPAWNEGAPAGPVLPSAAGRERLPVTVDLVGTPWTVDVGIDWNPKTLDRGTHLEKLNLHYMEYLLRLEPEDALRLMADWASRVPPYLPAYWKDTWNSYSLSIRIVTWLDVLTSRGIGAADPRLAPIVQSIAAQVRFLERNLETDIGGNHLMKNLRALLRAGSCLAGPEADRWNRRALCLLERELKEQVLRDGMHFELSPSYHLQVMEDLMDMRRSVKSLVDAGTAPAQAFAALQRLDGTLRLMAEVARTMTHPDGAPSLMADGGMHMAAPAAEILEWLARAQVCALGDARPGSGPWQLECAGYAGLRADGELLVVDCGPVGAPHLPAHGHGDALAVEWSVRGRRILIDPGVFEYHAGPRRAYARSTAAHSTLTVSDADQSEFWSAFRVGRRARVSVERWQPSSAGFVLVASHDGYRHAPGGPIHRRSIEAEPGRIEVRDEVAGGAGQPVRSRLLLAPDVSITSIRERSDGGSTADLRVAAGPGGDDGFSLSVKSSVPMRVEPADCSPDFGVSVRTQRLVLELGGAPCAATWVVTVE